MKQDEDTCCMHCAACCMHCSARMRTKACVLLDLLINSLINSSMQLYDDARYILVRGR